MFYFRLLGSSAAADAIRLASDYLCAVVCGHHVQGREFSYVSATPWNRMTFLWTTRLLLEPVARYLQYAAASELYSACSITHFIGVFLHIQRSSLALVWIVMPTHLRLLAIPSGYT